jgi:hypothetical protein
MPPVMAIDLPGTVQSRNGNDTINYFRMCDYTLKFNAKRLQHLIPKHGVEQAIQTNK